MNNDRKVRLVSQAVVFVLIIDIMVMAACAGQTGSTASTAPSQVEVIETEFSLELQTSTVKAGQLTFVVKNEGALEHNFVIEGTDQQIELILPQESKTVKANLSPGNYRLVCNLPGHEEAGMFTEITVE